MWLWLACLAAGAVLFVGLHGLAASWRYPAGTAGEIVGIPLLLYALTRLRGVRAYRLAALGTAAGLAAVHALLLPYGIPGVQLVYVGLALTAPRLRAPSALGQ